MRWKKVFAAVGCGALLLGGSPAMAAEQQNAVSIYKQAYLANIQDNRGVMTDIDLFGPNYHWELDADGMVTGDSNMCWHGNMSWDFTERSNNATSHEDIPFYLEQQDGIMTIYAQRAGKWGKISMPGIPAELAHAWKNGAVNFMDDSMQAIKKVTLENETDKYQGLRIVMDAGKMMQISENYWGDGPANIPAAIKQKHKKRMASLIEALKGTEVTVDWVINKADRKTVTISTDFTPLLRAYARNVIDNMAAGKIKLSDNQREMMESLGYFSELKFYISYKGAKQDENLSVPAAVRQSAVSLLNLSDIQTGVSQAVQHNKK